MTITTLKPMGDHTQRQLMMATEWLTKEVHLTDKAKESGTVGVELVFVDGEVVGMNGFSHVPLPDE